jgi:hypothetical protein
MMFCDRFEYLLFSEFTVFYCSPAGFELHRKLGAYKFNFFEASRIVLLKFKITMVPAPVSDQRQLTLTFCSLPLFGQRNKGENKG